MSHKKFLLTINEPCSQNWDEMTPQEKGNFCSRCTKVVLDFTMMSENQVIDFFKNRKEETCGRIFKHQLDHTYSMSLRKNPWYMNRFLQLALGGLLTLKTAEGATQSLTFKVEQVSLNDKEDQELLSSPAGDVKKTIEGKVTGENGHSLENTTVVINETGQSVKTDSAGNFKFELPENFSEAECTITFSHHGYESENRTIILTQLNGKKLIVRMYHHEIIMGKMMYHPK